MKIGMTLCLGLLCVPAAAFCAHVASDDKSIAAVRTTGSIVVDGALDEAAWTGAAVLEDFHQITPEEYDEPTERMQVLLLYDDDALYIGARLFNTDPAEISALVLRQGMTLRAEDRFKVVLSPFNDKRSGFAFFVNANGVRMEGLYKDNEFDRNWNGIWQATGKIGADGWTAEMAIPFKSLSFVSGQDWGFNVSRTMPKKQESMGWVSRNRSNNPSIAGTLSGLTGLSQGIGLDIVPAISVSGNRDYDSGEDKNDSEPSLDLFYKLTPSMNASLTLNTDFSATEVDNRQVNLTRFSLFFPEKRAFFLRESDIFEFGGITSDEGNQTFSTSDRESGRPYFSRRIGLSSSGEPVDLDVGAKISGRIGRWNIGTQVIHQAEFEDVDATDILVSRVSANVLEESTAGFIVTDGDPRSNLDNTLLGFDFLYRNTRLAEGRQLNANAWYQQTDTNGLNGDDAAFGFSIDAPNETGWKGGAGIKEIQANFNPAVGFISRAGVRYLGADVGYTFRPNGETIRSIEAGIDAQRVNLIDAGLQSQVVRIQPFKVRNNDDDGIEIAYKMQKENLLNSFEISDGIVVPAGNYDYDTTTIELETAAHRRADIDIEYEFGDFFGGDIQTIAAEFGWRPSKHFRTSLAYEVSDVDLPQGSFTTRLASANFEVVFSNTLSWVNLLQYDNVSDSIGLNSRLHWVPQAGRNVYLVLNHNYEERLGDGSFHSVSSDLTLKADYTFRF